MPAPRPPFVSVVIPVYNGGRLVDRALRSLLRQSFPDWEAWVVDDASTDDSVAVVEAWATTDPRLRVLRSPTNRGVSAARNAALDRACGEWIVYLDQDDEFDPEYLARVHHHRATGDVLVFQYDLTDERPDHPDFGRTYRYDPARFHEKLFQQHIAVPLGVAHRRALVGYTGGFDVRRPREQDSELWRRFATAGATFTFVPETSGLYHVRSDSAARTTPPDPPMAPRVAPRPWPGRNAAVVVTPFRPEEVADQPVVSVTVGVGERTHALRLPRADAWVARQVFLEGEYAGLPTDRLADPPVVVDVGAHCGVFAAYVRTAISPRAVVHSFEPYPLHIDLLRQNTAALSGVTVHPFALSDRNGSTVLWLDPTSGAGHSTVPDRISTPAGQVEVPMRDAARVWDELGLSEVDVLKVDAEGQEVPILTRLGERLDRVKVVLVEYHTVADEARVRELLSRHTLVRSFAHSEAVGTLHFVRSDLVSPPPPAVARHSAPAVLPPRPPGGPRVLFASYHRFGDTSSGASLCTRDLFDLLTPRGWSCGAFTGPLRDAPAPKGPPGAGESVARGWHGSLTFTVTTSTASGYPVSVFEPDPVSDRRQVSRSEAAAFAHLLGEAVRAFRPDVVLTYGGDPASGAVPRVAKEVGAKAVFWLHNRAYTSADCFAGCDAVVVPSESSREHYRATLGVEAVALPGPWNWERTRCEPAATRHVTFVNPEPAKGVFWFARMAEVLGRTRPDIPLLLVEGRGAVNWLEKCGVDLREVKSLRRMSNTPDPRRFYRLSKLVLMPSLVPEGLPRVAVEAMANSIPVIGSGRGGLAETLLDGGFQIDIPERYTPDTRVPPTEAEVGEWVAAIIRLWDDPAAYSAASAAARASAERQWHPHELGPRWAAFLNALAKTSLVAPR